MTIEGVVILIVGFSASVVLLSFAWWLWVRAPSLARDSTPRVPPRAMSVDDPRWMGWAEPGAPPSPPSAERTLFEQSTLEPVAELMGKAEDEGDLDKARTMFFVKKDPEKTQILPDGVELPTPPGADEDAPTTITEHAQTAPRRRAKTKTTSRSSALLPPPPPLRSGQAPAKPARPPLPPTPPKRR